MKSTMVLTTNPRGRPAWADVGWPACDERLVTLTDRPMLAEYVVTTATCGDPKE